MAVKGWVVSLSHVTHDALCRCGASRSWCACAYHNRNKPIPRALVALLDALFRRVDGPYHCRTSWALHFARRKSEAISYA